MTKIKFEPRSQEQMIAAVQNLLAFLIDHPDDYRWAEMADGYYITIPPVTVSKDSGLVVPPKKNIIT